MNSRGCRTGYQTVRVMQYTVPITIQGATSDQSADLPALGQHRAGNRQRDKEAALKPTPDHTETTFCFCTTEGSTDSCTPLVLKIRSPPLSFCYRRLHSRPGDASWVRMLPWATCSHKHGQDPLGIYKEAATLGSQLGIRGRHQGKKDFFICSSPQPNPKHTPAGRVTTNCTFSTHIQKSRSH